MRIFGYLPDRRVLDERPAFDAVAQPFFQSGNEIGCLVLHGIGGTPANVRPVADALAQLGYTVYAPLLPGHGETVRALNASTGAQWLRAAFAGYDRLVAAGCTRIVPVGLSLGGILSGLVAAKRPCAALVLLSAPIRMKPYLQLARCISPVVPYVRYSERDMRRIAEMAPYAQMYGGFSAVKLCDLNALARKLRLRLPAVSCPTLAVWAGRDNKVDKSSQPLLRALLKNAPLTEELLPDSPHGSTYGPDRDRVAALVADFIGRKLSDAPAPPPAAASAAGEQRGPTAAAPAAGDSRGPTAS